MSVFTKYVSIDAVAEATLDEIFCDMNEVGASLFAITVRDKDERVLGGMVFLRGPDADRYMQAIKAVEEEIEAEEEAQ